MFGYFNLQYDQSSAKDLNVHRKHIFEAHLQLKKKKDLMPRFKCILMQPIRRPHNAWAQGLFIGPRENSPHRHCPEVPLLWSRLPLICCMECGWHLLVSWTDIFIAVVLRWVPMGSQIQAVNGNFINFYDGPLPVPPPHTISLPFSVMALLFLFAPLSLVHRPVNSHYQPGVVTVSGQAQSMDKREWGVW